MQKLVLFIIMFSPALVGQTLAKSLAPANLVPYLSCPLSNDQTASHMIAGKQLRYRSSSEVGYDTRDWEERVAGSWDLLDENILEAPGYNVANDLVTPRRISENARVVAIDIRRHQDEWVYHYFSNGTAFHPIENWSATKIQAAFLAGLKLRHASNGHVGLDSTVAGQLLAQLITGIASHSHNDSAAWFKTIMGARAMTNYLNDWLLKSNLDYFSRKPTIGEIFLGRYGVPPLDLGGVRTLFRGQDGQSVEIRRDLVFPGDNTLSPLSMVESWKRIFAHEIDPTTKPKLNGAELREADLRSLFYGHPGRQHSALAGMLLGGTKKKIVKAMGGKELLDAKTGGKWRIFGKTGSGFSYIRKRHEAAFLGAVCFPAAEGGLQQTRAFVFFVNIQANNPSRRYEIRDTVIHQLTRLLVPELFSDSRVQ